MPHLSVRDIRSINWGALKAAGFKAVVFDKDNTLCEPFEVDIDAKLRPAVEDARGAFGGRLAIYSNSAGLAQYDPKGAALFVVCLCVRSFVRLFVCLFVCSFVRLFVCF